MNCPRCSESIGLARELHLNFDRYTCNRCGTVWDVWPPSAARKKPPVKGKEFDGEAYPLGSLQYQINQAQAQESRRLPQQQLPEGHETKGPDLR